MQACSTLYVLLAISENFDLPVGVIKLSMQNKE
jgi:hypothetical protein